MLKLGPKAAILDPFHRIIWLLLCYLVALRVHRGDPGDPSDRRTPQLMPISKGSKGSCPGWSRAACRGGRGCAERRHVLCQPRQSRRVPEQRPLGSGFRLGAGREALGRLPVRALAQGLITSALCRAAFVCCCSKQLQLHLWCSCWPGEGR